MITLIIMFCALNIIFGVLGIAFHVAFNLFKWIFAAVLAVGTVAFTLVFAVPLFVLVPFAAVIFVLMCAARITA